MEEVRRDMPVAAAMNVVTACAKRLKKYRDDGRAQVDIMALCNHKDGNVGEEARKVLDALVNGQPIPFVEQPIAA